MEEAETCSRTVLLSLSGKPRWTDMAYKHNKSNIKSLLQKELEAEETYFSVAGSYIAGNFFLKHSEPGHSVIHHCVSS